MFTFIRIAYHQALHGRNVEKLGHKPIALTGDKAEADEAQNPWETELSRIAGNRGEPPVKIHYRKGQLHKPSEIDPRSPEYHGKQGTLTDLKIWWSKATSREVDVKSFAPSRSRKPNRWYS